MTNLPTRNTYISITMFVWKKGTYGHKSGRIYTSVEDAKLDLHLNVDYKTAQKEMARLMLRTGQMPKVYGQDDPEMTMYALHAFLD